MSTNTDSIISTSASGDEIEAIINDLMPTLEGKPKATILIAALSLCYLIQSPSITYEQLVNAVRDTSQFIAMNLSGLGHSQPGEKAN